jgi:hypothetical protein
LIKTVSHILLTILTNTNTNQRSTKNATTTESTESPVAEAPVEPGDKSTESVPFYVRAIRAVRPKYASEEQKETVGAAKHKQSWKSLLRH